MKQTQKLFIVFIAVLSITSFAVAQSDYDPANTAPTPVVAPSDSPQPRTLAPSTGTVTGAVVTTTGSTVILRTQDGQQMSFVVDSTSKLPTNMATGDRVTVEYDTVAGGHHAKIVTVQTSAPPPEANPTPATTTTNPARTTTTTPPPVNTTDTVNPTGDTPYEEGKAPPMPKTASYLPLIFLVGMVCLGLALGFRAYTRRSEDVPHVV